MLKPARLVQGINIVAIGKFETEYDYLTVRNQIAGYLC